ncbi:MAG: S49 family peptidase [Planctomycetaceae bacterium]|nr:S49 family peptidase [Planctomycetaceae bacterium]
MRNHIEKLRAIGGDLWAMDVSRLSSYIPMEAKCDATIREAFDEREKAWAAARLPRANGTVAVIPVYGVLTKRGDWYTSSTDALGRVIDAAAVSANISGIVLDVDSPGGSVAGLPEFADKVYSARDAKPIVAVANPLAASAALWVGTAATSFVATPSADVGSHGVYSMHIDHSKMLEEWGLSVTLIHAGKYKVEGNPFQPLDDEGRAEFQRGVDEAYADFTSALSRNRGATRQYVRDNYGQGRVLSAQKALEVGMIDRIATLEETLAKMGAKSTETREAKRETESLQAAYYGKPVAAKSGVAKVLRARRERTSNAS